MRFKYIDAVPGHRGGGFSVTNENMKALRHLVEMIPSRKRLGGICSGGEVPITVLLPAASEEVVVVDQGLSAIGPALVKLFMLEQYGGAGMKVELSKRQPIDYLDLFKELPRDIGALVLEATRYFHPGYAPIWQTFDDKVLDEAREKLELLTVVHGDLSEIHKFAGGPFDALYTSNAMGWSVIGNYRTMLSTKHLEPALTPDGFLFGTSPLSSYSGWKPVRTYDLGAAAKNPLPPELLGTDGWSYGLWQRPEPTPNPVVVGDTTPPVIPPRLTRNYMRRPDGRFARKHVTDPIG